MLTPCFAAAFAAAASLVIFCSILVSSCAFAFSTCCRLNQEEEGQPRKASRSSARQQWEALLRWPPPPKALQAAWGLMAGISSSAVQSACTYSELS